MERAHIAERTKNEILKIERQIVDYLESPAPVASDIAFGRISRIIAIQNKSVTEAALHQAEDRLSKLRHALSK